MKIPHNLDTRRGRDLIGWIAVNDNAGSDDTAEDIAGYLTTTMLAHVYDVPNIEIARAILAIRERAFGAEAKVSAGS